jgi:hypothetical protein
MCSLKNVDDPETPPTFPDGADWASGTVIAPGVQPGGACRAEAANYRGTVLVLDANSWEYRGGPNHGGTVKYSSPEACCQVRG